jgi:IrrE N-terminal-like domain
MQEINPLKRFAEKTMASSPEEAMEFSCKYLRQKANETLFPIGLRSILSFLNLEHIHESGSGPLATLVRKKDGFAIKTRQFSKSSWRRYRFSIAHEIGHVILIKSLISEPEYYKSLRFKENWKAIELLCHFAASELLMPSEDFQLQIDNRQINRALLLHLYDRYLTSFEAIIQKIFKLNFDLLICWKNKDDNKEIWYIKKAFWNQDYFVPQRMTAEKHLFPNFFRYLKLYDDSISDDFTELKFGKTIYSGKSVTFLYPEERDSKKSMPLFEGFQVPDENTREYDAFTLLKINDPEPEHQSSDAAT